MLRGVLLAFSAVIIISAVAVGPLGISTDQTAEDTANVTLESAPDDGVVLERGRFGSGRYHVDAPPTIVTVGSVTGSPTLRYTIDFPTAGITVTSRYDIADQQGRLRMGASPTTISPERIEQSSYEGIVAIWLRTGTRDRKLLQRTITIEVRG